MCRLELPFSTRIAGEHWDAGHTPAKSGCCVAEHLQLYRGRGGDMQALEPRAQYSRRGQHSRWQNNVACWADGANDHWVVSFQAGHVTGLVRVAHEQIH